MEKVRRKKRGEEAVIWVAILGAGQREVGEADSRKIERVRWSRLEGRIRDVAKKVWLVGSQGGRVRVRFCKDKKRCRMVEECCIMEGRCMEDVKHFVLDRA